MSEKNLKAALKISLFAGTTLVAQSEDPILWQKIFATITSEDQPLESKSKGNDSFKEKSENYPGGPNDAITKFARALNMTEVEIQGACQPSKEAPYLHLNANYYESFIKNTPFRGPGSVTKIGLAATLLCLWYEFAKIGGQPSISDCQSVLATINLSEMNLTRSIKNSVWLQKTSQGLAINPAKRSRAIEIAKIYCSEGKVLT